MTIIEASNLVGKDGHLLGKATSDPFVKVLAAGEEIGKTKHVSKNLSPTWNSKVLTNHKIGPTFRHNPEIRLCIFDYDLMSECDPMGEVHRYPAVTCLIIDRLTRMCHIIPNPASSQFTTKVELPTHYHRHCPVLGFHFEVLLPLEKLIDGKELDGWFPVQPCKDCANATGRIRVKISFVGGNAGGIHASSDASLNLHAKELQALGWSELRRKLAERGLPDRGSTSELAHRLALALAADEGRGGKHEADVSLGLGGKHAADGKAIDTDGSADVPPPSSSFMSMLFGPSSSPSSAPLSPAEAFNK